MCKKLELQRNSYKANQILAFGPAYVYYYRLGSMAIDYIIKFTKSPKVWTRLPVNVIDFKKFVVIENEE